MQVETFAVPGPTMLRATRHKDDRGFLAETFHTQRFMEAAGMQPLAQENHVLSHHPYTMRGLHCQAPPSAQGKLVTCLAGRILDAAVDARVGSPTYGKHVLVELSPDDGALFFVPRGFLHGYLTLEPETQVLYKLDDYYAPSAEMACRFDDPDLGIDWGVSADQCHVHPKDLAAPWFKNFESPFTYEAAS
ncbi:MAG TPA: dTDP-4-dehydrorhamnose 3,5-epimerase [Alphaproteobacteria bacterium]|nr:dTDP-4-dehydrorhamnose 3,5-epimerase [Alphaproteobacteria bacterium]